MPSFLDGGFPVPSPGCLPRRRCVARSDPPVCPRFPPCPLPLGFHRAVGFRRPRPRSDLAAQPVFRGLDLAADGFDFAAESVLEVPIRRATALPWFGFGRGRFRFRRESVLEVPISPRNWPSAVGFRRVTGLPWFGFGRGRFRFRRGVRLRRFRFRRVTDLPRFGFRRVTDLPRFGFRRVTGLPWFGFGRGRLRSGRGPFSTSLRNRPSEASIPPRNRPSIAAKSAFWLAL